MALAETASIFCETLLFESAVEQVTDDAERLALLDTYLVGATQIVVDIHSRFLFETELCRRRRRTALSVAELNATMLDAQEAAYGDGLDPEHRHQYMWAVKPHYFTPFYNWPYTFGLLFGIGLYAQYVDDPERFRAGYDDLLSATGHGRRRDARRPVRLRRARPGVLGREPRGDRPPHRRLRRPGRRGEVTRRRRAARGGGGAAVHGLGLLAVPRPHARSSGRGTTRRWWSTARASHPICSTWERAAASGWPRSRCTRR